MLISIILPVYNVPEYIERSLRSALDQTYPDLEIIIVDDGSTDHSMQLVDSVIETHPRKDCVRKYAHATNMGPSAGRNTGLRHARGEYVFFLDNDDHIPAESIACLAFPLAKETPECVVGNYEVSSPENFKKLPLLLPEGLYHGKAVLDAYLDKKVYIMVWNKLYRRDFLLDNKLFFKEGLIHEDELWSFQVFTRLQHIAVVNAITYTYVIRKNSIMGSIRTETFGYRLQIAQEFVEWIKQYPALQNDPKVFYFVEDWKNKLFKSILRQSRNQERAYYNTLRETVYTKGDRFLLKTGSFKQRIRTIHYLLNQSMGFGFQKFILK